MRSSARSTTASTARRVPTWPSPSRWGWRRRRDPRHQRGVVPLGDLAPVHLRRARPGDLRIKAFRHVHDLPLLTQNTERRGALVSRVTSDVDQVSQFLVFGGLIFVVSVGQVLVATIVMVVYSWQLALVVWVCFALLFPRCASSSAS